LLKKDKEDEIEKIFNRWGIEYTVIGKVTSDGILRLKEGEKIVGEVPAKILS